jgi:hypothetical protein
LGDVSVDTTSTDQFGNLVDPNVPVSDMAPYTQAPFTPFDPSAFGALSVNPVEPSPMLLDPNYLPLPPVSIDPSLTPLIPSYPDSIGTEFLSQGDGTYMNIQTGQIVPMATAQAVTAATIGSATSNLDTISAQPNLTIVDPNTGVASTIATNNLTATAAALQAAGQLVNATGHLTAQGQALLNSGQLYKAVPAGSALSASGLSASISSIGSWFTGQTIIAGLPNWALLGAALVGVPMLVGSFGSGRGRRRR